MEKAAGLCIAFHNEYIIGISKEIHIAGLIFYFISVCDSVFQLKFCKGLTLPFSHSKGLAYMAVLYFMTVLNNQNIFDQF